MTLFLTKVLQNSGTTSATIRTNTFSCLFGACDEKNPHNNSTAAAATAAAEVALVVVRAVTTPKTWPRSTPKTTETGDASRGRLSSDDANRTALFFFWSDGCSAGSLSSSCQFFRAGVVSLFIGSIFWRMFC